MEYSKFCHSTTVVARSSNSKYRSIQSSQNQSRGDDGEQQQQQQQKIQVWCQYCHPQHPLVRVSSGSAEPFRCMGCKEYGAGTRFTCLHCCHYQLHDFCALAPTTLKNHPLHPQHSLQFSFKPVKGGGGGGGMSGKRCNICNKETAGYTFCCSCSACNFQMHPCCAMLSTQMSFPLAHPHPLILMPHPQSQSQSHSAAMIMMTSSSSSPAGFSCGECRSRKRSTGRVYRCTVPGCDYHLHAVCAKNMVNGLRANGITAASHQKPNRMLGTFSKIASLVVVEFVGGLIGGLGQNVGDVLAQTIAADKGLGATLTASTMDSN